jgi:putative membrane protein
MWWHGMGWHGYGFGGLGIVFGGLMMLLFWGGLIVLAFFVIRALARSGSDLSAPPLAGSNRALDILKERYARGEVTKEQYEQIYQDLIK